MTVDQVAALFLYLVIGFGLYWIIAHYWHGYRLLHADYLQKTDNVILQYIGDLPYFKELSNDGRVKFTKRVRYLASNKSYVGMKGLHITDEMRVRISAALVQLTFGYRQFKLYYFNQIRIYPDIFYSRSFKRNVKGLTGRRSISLSWPDFVHGYEEEDDNYNLGLHEIAHALHISASKDQVRGDFTEHFTYWAKISLGDFRDLKRGDSKFLRSYGGVNFHEFFAVCIEHFFESPEEFKSRLPKLYKRTVVLLNQDPLEYRNDYAPNLKPEGQKLTEAFGREPALTDRFDKDVTLIFIGVFVAFIVMNLITEQAAINYVDKLIAILFLSLPAFALYPRFKRKKRFNYLLIFSMFAIFGIGCNAFALILIANHYVPGITYQEEHKITSMTYEKGLGTVFELEENAFHRYKHIRSDKSWYRQKPESVTFTFRRGFLGIPEVKSKKIQMAVDIQ